MKRLWVAATVLIAAAGLIGWYYASAWSLARDTAVSVAAGEQVASFPDAPWTLSSGADRDYLDVETHAGWIELGTHLAPLFTVTDSDSGESVEFSVDVEFDAGRWRVIGVGAGG